MSVTNISTIDVTVQKTQIWVKDLMSELDWDSADKAFQALKVVLQALRDRLPIQESADLAAQLPMLIRGMYYEGWSPLSEPDADHGFSDFVQHVSDHFQFDTSVDPEWTTRSVMKVIAKHVSAGEMEDVKACLPQEFRDLWN